MNTLNFTKTPGIGHLQLVPKGRIGVVVDSSIDPWFVQLLVAIEEELSRRGTSMLLASLQMGRTYQAHRVLRWIRERQVDGLILAKSSSREECLLTRAIESKLPVVAVAPDEAVDNIPHVQVVRCDNFSAGARIADLLIDLGHRRIGFAGGPGHSDSLNRLHGLKARLAELRTPLDSRFIYSCKGWAATDGIDLGEQLFSQPLQITAIVAANDALALGLMRAAQFRNIQIPQRLSVSGFDDVPEAALLWPGLTTVAQPMREMGKAACDILFDAIAATSHPELIEYSMKLVVRESTGPVPV